MGFFMGRFFWGFHALTWTGDQAGEYRGGADASRWLGECVVLRQAV